MTRKLFLVWVLALVATFLPACQSYDHLVELDQVCEQKWADYEAQLQRRYDLVPNLVATVKASAQHEEKTLSEVTQARADATSVKLTVDDMTDQTKLDAFNKAQEGLHGALSRLLVANENYPDLKANAQFHDLQVQLEGTENRILRSREEYNKAVKDYNAELGKIKGQVVNKATGKPFAKRAYFTAVSEAQTAPKVSF